MKQQFLGLLAGFLFKIYSSTFRYRVFFEDENDAKIFFEDSLNFNLRPGESFLYAFFHQDELGCIPYFSYKNICVLVSKSKDGTIMSTLAEFLGYKTVRGSSSRGAIAALLASIKMVKKGHKLSMAVDGPKGPIYKVKDGIPKICEKTGNKIVPFRAIPHRYFSFDKAWNKARLPKLFSKVDMVIGKIDKYSKEELEQKLLQMSDYSKFHRVDRYSQS